MSGPTRRPAHGKPNSSLAIEKRLWNMPRNKLARSAGLASLSRQPALLRTSFAILPLRSRSAQSNAKKDFLAHDRGQDLQAATEV